jgi:hypothetical protein
MGRNEIMYRGKVRVSFEPLRSTLAIRRCPPVPVNKLLRRPGVCLFLLLLISLGGVGISSVRAQSCNQSLIFADDFESDPSSRWTISRESTDPSTFVARDWTWVNSLPGGRAGSAFFAPDPVAFGLCSSPPPGQAGVLLLESPAITLPAVLDGRLRVSFDHWVSLEEGFDGAQLMISVNGGPYVLVGSESNADFISNPYNFVLFTIGGEGKNPRFGQPAWSGVGGGLPDNSWGNTIVDLSRYAQPGDTIRLRWDMSTDYCFGTDAGWYVDNVKVYTCPLRTVSGRVTGNGQPLGGINVTAYQWSSDLYSWQPTESSVTASDGSYALLLLGGTYRVGFIDTQGPYGTLFFNGADKLDQADDVVVGSGDVTNINANMILNHPITGTVTVEGVNMPGVVVTAYRQVPNGIDWEAVKYTTTGLDGTYALYLLDGTYRVGFATWQGRFGPGFYDNAISLDTATDIIVTGAEVPNIDAHIYGAPNSGPAITGTVTVASTGAPAEGVIVIALKWDGRFWAPVRSVEVQPDGTYTLYVPEGTYRVDFEHNLNRYRRIFYDGAATLDAATDVIVPTAGAPNINAQLVENHYISGTLTADAVPELPPGPPPTAIAAWRLSAFNGWEGVGSAFSAPDGSYVLYVPDGTYRIGFNPVGPYHPTYYDEADTLAEANDVIVAGGNVSDINAHLQRIIFATPWPIASTLSDVGQDAWGPQVAAGPDGAVTAVWYRRDGRNSRVQVATVAPNEYWSSPTDLSPPGEDASDPQVAMGDRGTAVVVWRGWDGSHYRVQAISRGENGKWSAPVTLSKAGEDAWDPQVAIGPHGMAVVAWRRSDGTNHQVQATTRVAYGPWSAPVTLSTVGGDAWDPQAAVGADGSAIVVWSRSDGSNERVQATTRAPNGSWPSPVTLSDAGADSLNPQVVVGPDGAGTAIWRDGSGDRIKASSRPAKGVWSTPATLSTVSGNVYDPELAVDPDGMVTAVWSWWDGDRGQIQTASRPRGGAWSRPKTLSNCCGNAEGPRIAAGSAGRFTALWRESSFYSSVEHLVAAIRTPDGSWSAPIIVSEDSPRAYGAQVAAGSDGTVAAVWERRDAADDRVQAVVVIPVPESRSKP